MRGKGPCHLHVDDSTNFSIPLHKYTQSNEHPYRYLFTRKHGNKTPRKMPVEICDNALVNFDHASIRITRRFGIQPRAEKHKKWALIASTECSMLTRMQSLLTIPSSRPRHYWIRKCWSGNTKLR
jgi:hypothetical protein